MDLNTKLRAKILNEMGNKYLDNEDYKEAEALYTKAIELNPTDEVVYLSRSYAYMKLYKMDLAMDDALKAIKLKPNCGKGYIRKGNVEYYNMQAEEALKSFKKAQELSPYESNVDIAIEKLEQAVQIADQTKHNLPSISANLGLTVGILCMIIDYFTEEPSLTNPLVQVFFTQLMSGSFWFVTYTITCPDLYKNRNVYGLKLHLFPIYGMFTGMIIMIIDIVIYNKLHRFLHYVTLEMVFLNIGGLLNLIVERAIYMNSRRKIEVFINDLNNTSQEKPTKKDM